MLAELGFGLDLEAARRPAPTATWAMCRRNPAARCRAAPPNPGRTGCCGCRRFCRSVVTPSLDDIADGFALTGFFLARHVLEPRGLAFADAREGFVAAVLGRRLPARVAQ